MVSISQQPAVEQYVETRCGIQKCRPACIQHVNNPKILCLCLCLYTVVQGFAVNGINNVNTTSYERRFQLTSSQVGWISSAFDISAAIFGVVIGFYGNRRHKARILTVAFFIASLGSLCMFLPHFITGPYQWGQEAKDTCSSAQDFSVSCDKEESGISSYLAMLIIGQMMHGIGGSTLITVGYSLMDDSVPAVSAPLYIALLGLCQAVGPMLGFIVGGALLNVYVDYPKVPRENWVLGPSDPRWVGGWWIGFFMSSLLMFLLALPFLLFGAELPTAKHVRETRVSETHNDPNMFPVRHLGDPFSLKQFPVSVLRLLKNPAYMCVTLGFAFSGLVTLGLATFLPKYLQNMYDLTAAKAAMAAGIVIVPGAALGQLLGGAVLRRWKLKVKGILRFIFIIFAIGLLTKSAFFISCDKDKLVGWNIPYPNSSETGNLSSICNADCSCNMAVYQPVCDTTGRIYFSPCLAGCSGQKPDKIYTDCQCISTVSSNSTTVSDENCLEHDGQCNRPLILFLIIVFLGAVMTGSSGTPVLMVVLRCTHDNERTLALGLINFLARIFGSIPGPIIYGAVIDSTCGIWGNSCGTKSSCWVYDTSKMGIYLAIMGLLVAVLSAAFYFLAYRLYKPPRGKDTTIGLDISTMAHSKEILTTDNVDVKM